MSQRLRGKKVYFRLVMSCERINYFFAKPLISTIMILFFNYTPFVAMPISQKVKESITRASWIRKMFEEGILLKKTFGEEEVLDFSLGNPTMEPPEEFFAELERLAGQKKNGRHRYMPNAGFSEVREAVAKQISLESGVAFTPQCVIMSCGAAGGLNVAIKTIADPGDEILILAPFFAEYLFYAENHGIRPVIVETDENFDPDLDAIERSITPKTRGIILNSPNNPTGKVYGESFYQSLNELLIQKEKETGQPIYVLADDPYHKLAYDGLKPPPAPKFIKNCLRITSHSKDLSIPGERIGYLAISPNCEDFQEIVDGATFCNRTLGFVNAPALAQRLVAGLQSLSVDIADYQFKRDLLYNALKETGYEVQKPCGAFYLFPKAPLSDDLHFVKILQEKKVLTVPGTGFGRPGYFRIAYCVSEKVIQRSLDRFKDAFDEVAGGNS